MRKWCSTSGFSRTFSVVFTIELTAKTMRTSFPLVYDGEHTTNTVGMVSQDVAPLGTNTTTAQEPRVFEGILTLINRVGTNLEQVQ
jgi:hypothetical protein